MYYEFNVSLKGQHFFATAERSVTDATKAIVVHEALCAKFPAEEGYKITLTKYETYGQQIDPSTLVTSAW